MLRLGTHPAVGQKLDRADLALLDDTGPLGTRVVEKHEVEVGATNLVGVGEILVPGIGELERDGFLVVGRNELGAILQQRKIQGQQRLADVKARMLGLFDQHHMVAAARK